MFKIPVEGESEDSPFLILQPDRKLIARYIIFNHNPICFFKIET